MTIKEELERAKASDVLTVRQLALLTQYEEQTIYRKAKRGEIPGVIRYGRTLRFDKAQALAWGEQAQLARDLRPRHAL